MLATIVPINLVPIKVQTCCIAKGAQFVTVVQKLHRSRVFLERAGSNGRTVQLLDAEVDAQCAPLSHALPFARSRWVAGAY